MSQRGFSLIEVMIAIALGGAVVFGVIKLTNQTVLMQRETRGKLELEEIRRYLTQALSCDKTLYPKDDGVLDVNCQGKGLVDVKGGDGKVILGKPFAKLGAFAVRASCKDFGKDLGLYFEAKRADDAGNALPDPITRQLADWEPLFEEGLSPCSSAQPPKEVIVKADLKLDPASMITVAGYLLGVYHGPVIACADSEWTDPEWRYETSLPYQGHAYCPRGYTIVGGGVDCSLGADGSPDTDFIPALNSNNPSTASFFRRRGYKLTSDPIFDELIADENLKIGRAINVWHGSCCVRVDTIPLSATVNLPLFPLNDRLNDRVFARCMRND